LLSIKYNETKTITNPSIIKVYNKIELELLNNREVRNAKVNAIGTKKNSALRTPNKKIATMLEKIKVNKLT
jgi:hypothetical protein